MSVKAAARKMLVKLTPDEEKWKQFEIPSEVQTFVLYPRDAHTCKSVR